VRDPLRLNVLGLPAGLQRLLRALVDADDVNTLTAMCVLLFQACRGLEKEGRATNVHALIDALQHTIKFMWGTDQVQVWVVDGGAAGGRARSRAGGGEMWTRGVGKMVVRASADDGLVGACLRSGRTIVLADGAPRDPRFAASVDSVSGGKPRVFMAAPVPSPSGGKPMGVVQVARSKRAAAFDAVDLTLLELVALKASALLSAAEKQSNVSAQHNELSSLLRVQGRLAEKSADRDDPTATDRIRMARTIEEQAREFLNVTDAKVFVCESPPLEEGWSASPDAPPRRLWSVQEDYDRETKQKWHRIGTGICWHAVKARESVATRDPYSDPRFNGNTDMNTKRSAMICVPVVNHCGQAIGALEVADDTQSDVARERLVGLTEAFAGQAAHVVEAFRRTDFVRRRAAADAARSGGR
jgi:GAF domain-containing protein